jgi:hypothetical protein
VTIYNAPAASQPDVKRDRSPVPISPPRKKAKSTKSQIQKIIGAVDELEKKQSELKDFARFMDNARNDMEAAIIKIRRYTSELGGECVED